jgi:hypothetical protein
MTSEQARRWRAIAVPTVSVRPFRIRTSSARQAVTNIFQRIEIGNTRHRNQVVASEVTTFAFSATFLITLTGRAELRGKQPVRAERHEPHRLLPPVVARRNLRKALARLS